MMDEAARERARVAVEDAVYKMLEAGVTEEDVRRGARALPDMLTGQNAGGEPFALGRCNAARDVLAAVFLGLPGPHAVRLFHDEAELLLKALVSVLPVEGEWTIGYRVAADAPQELREAAFYACALHGRLASVSSPCEGVEERA